MICDTAMLDTLPPLSLSVRLLAAGAFLCLDPALVTHTRVIVPSLSTFHRAVLGSTDTVGTRTSFGVLVWVDIHASSFEANNADDQHKSSTYSPA